MSTENKPKSTYKPKSGTTVYLLNGQTAKYVARDGENHIVRPIIEAYHGDESWDEEGNPTSVGAVFSKPPTEKLHAEVAELNATIAEREARLSELAEQEQQIKNSERDRAQRLKKHEALRLIDDYLAGKIRYLVTGASPDQDMITIIDTQSPQMSCGGDARHLDRSRMRLLSLFGGEGRKAWWELNRYSDDSGDSKIVVPCITLEEAKAKALEIYNARIKAWRSDDRRHNNYYEAARLADAATKLEFDFPEDMRTALAENGKKGAEKKVSDLKRALETAEAQLAEIAKEAK